MRNIRPKILLTTLGLIFSSANSFATECTPAPDCANLGYNKTATDCEEMSVKCPTDTSKVYCLTQSGENNSISAGAILYGDGTINSSLISGKKPIGVVFDVVNRLAVALTDIKKDGSSGREGFYGWSTQYCDIPELENCKLNNCLTTCSPNGQENTKKILATNGGCSEKTTAVNATQAYEPQGCTKDFCKKGKWFLPSSKELYNIGQLKISTTLTLLSSVGATPMEGMYWSSSENSEYYAFGAYMPQGNIDYIDKKDSYKENYVVRPIIKY